MHVPTMGRILGEVIEQGGTCLIFEKLVVHRALRVHHFGRVALVREREKLCLGSFCFGFGSWFSRFPSASCMTASSVTSLRSHVLAFDRLRRVVALVLGNRSVLE